MAKIPIKEKRHDCGRLWRIQSILRRLYEEIPRQESTVYAYCIDEVRHGGTSILGKYGMKPAKLAVSMWIG